MRPPLDALALNDFKRAALRDKFAAFALAGILANSTEREGFTSIAAYRYADAMLAQRQKETK